MFNICITNSNLSKNEGKILVLLSMLHFMEFQVFNFKITVSLLLSIHKKLIGILIVILQVYQL